jgi:MFS family permease
LKFLTPVRFSGLWLHAEFRKLWIGQASSLLGTQFVNMALPLTAAIVLDASPIQMGVVTAMTGAPAFLGIFIGAWIDRRPRLPILIGSDLGRAALLALIPISYFLDILSIWLIYVVAFGLGLFTMAFSIGYRAFLPTVVAKSELVEANSKLELAGSGTSAVGPAAAGALVQAVNAPFAIIFGVFNYVISALLFRWIRVTEHAPKDASGNGTENAGGIAAGIRFFRSNSTLVAIAGSQATLVLFSAGFMSIGLLYKVRDLEITPWLLGGILSAGSIGSLFGAIVATKITRRIGIGKAMVGGLLIISATELALPIVGGSVLFIAIVLVVAIVAGDAGNVIYSITQMSIRQATTPDNFQGRVSSIFATLVRLGWPVGGLLSGFLAESFGLRIALFIGAAGTGSAALWLIYGGLWKVSSLEAESKTATPVK